MSFSPRTFGTFPTAGGPIDYRKRPDNPHAVRPEDVGLVDKSKCPGCGSLEFQDCEKGLVCSYCRVVIRPKAKAQDLHVHAPYVVIETPVIKDPEVDKRFGLTIAQAATRFRALGRML